MFGLLIPQELLDDETSSPTFEQKAIAAARELYPPRAFTKAEQNP